MANQSPIPSSTSFTISSSPGSTGEAGGVIATPAPVAYSQDDSSVPDRGRTLIGRHAHAVVLSRSASATRSGSRTPCDKPMKGVLKKDTIKSKRDSSVRSTSISAEELLEQALKDSKKRIAEKPIPLPDHLPTPADLPSVLQPVNVASGTVTVPKIPKVPILIPNVPPLYLASSAWLVSQTMK